MNHYVYRLVDPKTNEFYFGVRTCECDPNEDEYMGSYKRWHPEDDQRLEKTILLVFDDRDKAFKCEHKLIGRFSPHPKNRNYHNNKNFTFYNGSHSQETKERISKKMTGRKLTKEHKRKVKENHAKPNLGKEAWNKGKKFPEWSGENHWLYGKHHSLETKKKMGRSVIKQSKENEYIEEFYSMAEAERQTGIFKANIQKVCAGERNTAGGFKWKYKDS